MIVELFKQEFCLFRSAHQAHLVYRVYVPRSISEIVVQFQYGPILESHQATIRKAVAREGLSESVVREDTTVQNLLTVSINDPQGFRGARHFSSHGQTIRIGSEKATEGFNKGMIPEGVWEFSISCHGVFSEKVTGQIAIMAVSDFDETRKAEVKPLKDIKFSQNKKNRGRGPHDEALVWRRLELHSHTIHSDASQTTEELLTQAENEQIEWLAITDHNTMTALVEAERHNNFSRHINLLDGIEYTTFHGHFLVHGLGEEILMDWTRISKNSLAGYLEKFKKDEACITIAHPFDRGNPFCTGCRWEYVLEDLKYIDAIEVWNGTNPHQSLANEEAFYRWTTLLEQGYEIAASSGRDWHRLHPGEEIAYTYILVPPSEVKEDLLNALKLGRTYSSIRPRIDFKVNDVYILGDRVVDKTGELMLSVAVHQLKEGDQCRIYSQNSLVFEKTITVEQQWEEEIRLDNDGFSLLRMELVNKENERVAFTNPIYIHSSTEKG